MKYDVKNLVLFNKNPDGAWNTDYGFSKEEKREIANAYSGGEINVYLKLVQFLKADWDSIEERNDGYATVGSLRKWIKSFQFDNIELGVGTFDKGTYISVINKSRNHRHGDYYNVKASQWDLNKFNEDDLISRAVSYARYYEQDYYSENDPYGKVLDEYVRQANYLANCSYAYESFSLGDIIRKGNLPSVEELKGSLEELNKVVGQAKANEQDRDNSWKKYWSERDELDKQIKELEKQKKALSDENEKFRDEITNKNKTLWQGVREVLPMLKKD